MDDKHLQILYEMNAKLDLLMKSVEKHNERINVLEREADKQAGGKAMLYTIIGAISVVMPFIVSIVKKFLSQ